MRGLRCPRLFFVRRVVTNTDISRHMGFHPGCTGFGPGEFEAIDSNRILNRNLAS